jgi:hypothetical protein
MVGALSFSSSTKYNKCCYLLCWMLHGAALQVNAHVPEQLHLNLSYPCCSRVGAALCGVRADRWVAAIKHRAVTGRPQETEGGAGSGAGYGDRVDGGAMEEAEEEDSALTPSSTSASANRSSGGSEGGGRGGGIHAADRVYVSACSEEVEGYGEVTATVVVYLVDPLAAQDIPSGTSPGSSSAGAGAGGYPLQLWRCDL